MMNQKVVKRQLSGIPGLKGCAQMADLENEAYKGFVCVETTNAADELVTIAPGQFFQLVAVYQVERN